MLKETHFQVDVDFRSCHHKTWKLNIYCGQMKRDLNPSYLLLLLLSERLPTGTNMFFFFMGFNQVSCLILEDIPMVRDGFSTVFCTWYCIRHTQIKKIIKQDWYIL